ncbi:hypothetical protein BofuT4_uP139840.1 [Botrytis cinerea T4]|uniref:Uncharacterized protein n=1 Tax=Botryotinia fuckeliana (strain T4) TaxID=999810 RepID=G2YN62_BOTF4|nr:hypothetical protein BofuT4_uP139840.1 [Botrytis cinerea T4]
MLSTFITVLFVLLCTQLQSCHIMITLKHSNTNQSFNSFT